MSKKSSIKMPKKKTKDQWVGSGQDTVRMTVDIPQEEYIRFKIAATKERKHMSELLRQYISEYGKQ